MTDFEVLPPAERPPNESAGYLGYYARRWLPRTFTLTDLDGGWPAVWLYWRASRAGYYHRIFEEKPHGQKLHDAQTFAFRTLVDAAPTVSVYVIYAAERLVVPTFPIRIQKIGANAIEDRTAEFDRDTFDKWLTDGLVIEQGAVNAKKPGAWGDVAPDTRPLSFGD